MYRLTPECFVTEACCNCVAFYAAKLGVDYSQVGCRREGGVVE